MPANFKITDVSCVVFHAFQKFVAEFVARSGALSWTVFDGRISLPLRTYGHPNTSLRKLPSIDTIDGVGGNCVRSGRCTKEPSCGKS